MSGARPLQRSSARRSSLGRLAAIVATGVLFTQACSGSLEGPTGGVAAGAGQGNQAGAGGRNVIMPDGSAPLAGDGGQGTNPLCGTEACNPDDSRSCEAFVPLSEAEARATLAGGAGGHHGGAGSDAGHGGAGSDAGGFAGKSSAGGTSSPGPGRGEGGASTAEEGGSGGVEAPVFACRVVRASRSPATECRASGNGKSGGPCFDGSDCAAGLACVSENDLGRCRPYCCGGESSCKEGSYCAERELLEETPAGAALTVPVCVPADGCDLAQPPCEVPGDCECAPGTACQVVRPDGTTACVVPGEGGAGEPCPCAHGHICSRAANTCLALCRIDEESLRDAGTPACKRCQVSAELPDGWGVCIGG